MYRFDISGFAVNNRGEDMKKQARRASHQVASCDEVVTSCGPFRVEEKSGEEAVRHLTRRELVFGLKGFGGLVIWRGTTGMDMDDPEGSGMCIAVDGEVIIDSRAKMLGLLSEWIIDFVRQIIVKAGWRIIQEEDLLARYRAI